MDDLCIICPGGHWKAVMEALLERHIHLGIREVECSIFSVPLGRNPLIRREAATLAKRCRQGFNHCLVIVDHDTSGDPRPAHMVEADMNKALAAEWGTDARALVVSPSVEAWLLEGHQVFSRVRGLRGLDVRKWMAEQGLWPEKADMPENPRAVVEELFLEHGARPSAANYRLIADEAPIRLDRCQAESFRRMVLVLREWFLP